MEALNRRLPAVHPLKETVNGQARILRAGHNGEAALQFPLDFLSYDDFLIFYHLRIPDANGYFQIDALLLCNNFILIIEVKNIDGEVYFDDMGQSVRKKEGKEDSLTNPIEQIKLQHVRLLRWLRNFDFPAIPIEKIAVYTQKTLLKDFTSEKTIKNSVMRMDKLLSRIEEIQLEYTKSCLTDNQVNELAIHLLSAHTDETLHVLDKYKISFEELLKGVICPICMAVPMIRAGGKWKCNVCQQTSKTAHRKDLDDYALLINEYIGNKETRDFLLLASVNIAKNLLNEYPKRGNNSGRKYYLK